MSVTLQNSLFPPARCLPRWHTGPKGIEQDKKSQAILESGVPGDPWSCLESGALADDVASPGAN